MRQHQRGMTFFGVIFVGAVLVFGTVIGMQLVPTYIEYLAVAKAVKKSATGSTVSDVRKIFDNAATIDDIFSVSGKDLQVGKQGDKVVVTVAYQREVHIGGPAFIVMKYDASSQ
jgi:Domain of unknown function (DUF4845)